MNTTAIIIREFKDSKYQVFDGDLLLACFGSKTAAEEFALRCAPHTAPIELSPAA